MGSIATVMGGQTMTTRWTRLCFSKIRTGMGTGIRLVRCGLVPLQAALWTIRAIVTIRPEAFTLARARSLTTVLIRIVMVKMFV